MIPSDESYATETLRRLVSINSINPAFDPTAPGEAEAAEYVAGELRACGCEVELVEPQPRRTSVVGRLGSPDRGRSLLLYSHLDTVGIEGMAGGLAPLIKGNRLYGRGAYDMKSGMAAILAAVRALAARPPGGELIVAGVADEEVASLGMQAVLERVSPQAAIVTEPTELDIVVAHKGFCWIDVVVTGRAAHGSRFDEGVDANLRMGRFLAELGLLEAELRSRPPHALVGPPSLHVGLLRGGLGESTYAPEARANIERRTLPGESDEAVLAEVRAIIDRLSGSAGGFQGQAVLRLSRRGFETPATSPIRTLVRQVAAHRLGREPLERGVGYWMDAALLGAAGVDTVTIGAAGAGAHSAVEWVELDSVHALAAILSETVLQYWSS